MTGQRIHIKMSRHLGALGSARPCHGRSALHPPLQAGVSGGSVSQ
jgi:hypothetical protein